MWSRRALLQALGASVGAATLGFPTVAYPGATTPRLVVIVLRGGMDGLHAVVPYGDPAYSEARGRLAMHKSELLNLDGFYGLHPALAPLHSMYQAGELLPLHAVGVAAAKRSHFDAQDMLENGTTEPGARHDGWLNRALAVLPGSHGVAVGAQTPLLLRGDHPVQALNPRRTGSAHASLFDEVMAMYERDPELSAALHMGLDSLELLPDEKERTKRGLGDATVGAVANALNHRAGPSVVALGVGGWDTHTNQGTVKGGLANRFAGLASGLDRLKMDLGPAWRHTAVLVVTEFGRRVKGNGTGGSDHGTGGAALLLGGAVAGGRVVSDWPGLAPMQLLRSRDLRPTLDLRQLFKGVLHEHLRVASADLAATIFPDSGDLPALTGLMRG